MLFQAIAAIELILGKRVDSEFTKEKLGNFLYLWKIMAGEFFYEHCKSKKSGTRKWNSGNLHS